MQILCHQTKIFMTFADRQRNVSHDGSVRITVLIVLDLFSSFDIINY